MAEHDQNAVAHIAATLLSGFHNAEPHNIEAAVANAKAILDASAPEPKWEPKPKWKPKPESEPEPEPAVATK